MAEEFRTPQSANEAALQNWAGADNELRAPQSRIEKLLLAILGEDVTPDPPQSVNEELLTQILEQGGGGGKVMPVCVVEDVKVGKILTEQENGYLVSAGRAIIIGVFYNASDGTVHHYGSTGGGSASGSTRTIQIKQTLYGTTGRATVTFNSSTREVTKVEYLSNAQTLTLFVYDALDILGVNDN